MKLSILTDRRLLLLSSALIFLGGLLFFLKVRPLLAVEYQNCETGSTCQVGEFLYNDDYSTVDPADASCTLTVRDPGGTPISGSPFTMSEAADGWFYYDLDTTGLSLGNYRSTMCCTVTNVTPNQTLCLDKSISIIPVRLTAAAIWSYSARSLTTFGTLVADIWSFATRSLTTREITPTEHIAQEETLERQWTTRFSGDGEVLVGKAYRAKLWVLNTQTELADAVSNPAVTIYDANRANPSGVPATMTKIATGTYELVWTVPTGSVAGRWETVVTVDIGGTAPIQDGSYWEVETDSPAQVQINAITDNVVPSIAASITIKNEGGSDYEYQYAYCVVDDQSNQCGGGDDVFYGADAKYILAGQSWTTTLNATVPNPGLYWFKLIVYWGTEKSAAVRQFNAVSGVICLGDINNDGWVDLTDFSILLYYWKTSNPTADLNNDGIVNLTDFSIMLFHWGKCP